MNYSILNKDSMEISDVEHFNGFNEKFHSPAFITIKQHALSVGQYDKLWLLLNEFLPKKCLSLNCSELSTCLNTIRILSRDKTAVNQMVEESNIEMLLKLAGVAPPTEKLSPENFSVDEKYQAQEEACKCLSNLIFQTHVGQTVCCKSQHAESALTMLNTDKNIPHTLKISYLKLVFLISALNNSTRTIVVQDHDALSIMLELLKCDKDKNSGPTMQRNTVELTVEVLKLLYNLCLGISVEGGCGGRPGEGCKQNGEDKTEACGLQQKDQENLNNVVSKVRELLVSTAHTHEHTQLMHSHCINVLVSVPTCVLPSLTPFSSNGGGSWWGGSTRRPTVYKGQDMSAICQILAFLHARLNAPGQQTSDNLSPVLSMLISSCESSRVLRKFVRLRVMPPLKDVTNRPEEGSSVRNRLVKLMTSPVLKLKHLSATLLFVLSNHSVDRLIKYSGYGNCAGLLASLGLLSAKNDDQSVNDNQSDSEDSETEEYERVKHMVNPVTGCYEPVRPNPLDDMTEEQKEYETNKLVNALDKLMRDGVIKPCGIGPDGKPEPMEHVLQLQDSKFNPNWTGDSKCNENSDDSN